MVGPRLAELRNAAELSARELSLLAGLSHSLVGLIESGHVETPTSATSAALARVLGCSLDWFISGVGSAPSARAVKLAVVRARAAETKGAA